MPVDPQGQIENANRYEQQGSKHQCLDPSSVAHILSDISKLRCYAEAKNQQQENHSKKIRNKVQRVTRPRIGDGFFIALMGENVLFGFCLFGSLGRSRWSAGQTRLRLSRLGV